MIAIQHGTWPGWPDGVTVELEENTAAAVLTAARDFQAESGVNLGGDLLVLPAGGLRPADWIAEMQHGFDLHKAGAAGWQPIYQKYNMDTASKARPATSSTHALGICADIADNRFLNWLIANGTRYGLRRTLVALDDLRHFQFFPGTATVDLDVKPINNSTNTEGLDMPILHPVSNAEQYGFPFLLAYTEAGKLGRFDPVDQHAHDNLVTLGVPEGGAIVTNTLDEIASQHYGATVSTPTAQLDPAVFAKALAPLLGGQSLTVAQVEAAAETAVKTVLGSLAPKA